MNARSCFRKSAAGYLAAAVSLSLCASANPVSDSNPVAAGSPGETLSSIYAVLLPTNRNYEGHRGVALREIRDAAAAFGVELRGVGGGNFPQDESDDRFRFARENLERLADSLTGPADQSAATHIRNAADQLGRGLKVVTPDPYPVVSPIPLSAEDADALQTAYLILCPGNGNYSGHRAAAMSKIVFIARLSGLNLVSVPAGHEDQQKSDARLQLAQRYLIQVRDNLTAEEYQPIVNFLNAAIDHLDAGLKYRATI
jgi:hypothetical protein